MQSHSFQMLPTLVMDTTQKSQLSQLSWDPRVYKGLSSDNFRFNYCIDVHVYRPFLVLEERFSYKYSLFPLGKVSFATFIMDITFFYESSIFETYSVTFHVHT